VKRTGWRVGAAAAYVGMLVVNGLAGSTTSIGGVTTGDVSDSYPNLFAPAGFTFSVWGVIYLLLAVYTGYSLLALRRPDDAANALVDRLTPLYLGTSVANSVWLFCWQYGYLGLSVVVMLVLLALLIRIRALLAAAAVPQWQGRVIGWPFSVYLGWITVATIADITTWLVGRGRQGTGGSAAAWTVAVLVVATVIAVAVVWRLADVPYGLVIVWALWGILSKHLSGTGWDGKYPGVIATLYGALAVVVVALAVVGWRRSRERGARATAPRAGYHAA
jgi:hypothetical protein